MTERLGYYVTFSFRYLSRCYRLGIVYMFKLHVREVGDSVSIVGGVVDVMVMDYGVLVLVYSCVPLNTLEHALGGDSLCL